MPAVASPPSARKKSARKKSASPSTPERQTPARPRETATAAGSQPGPSAPPPTLTRPVVSSDSLSPGQPVPVSGQPASTLPSLDPMKSAGLRPGATANPATPPTSSSISRAPVQTTAQPSGAAIPDAGQLEARQGLIGLNDVTAAERLRDIAGVPGSITNRGAHAYLQHVRAAAEDKTDPVEQMHLDLAAASYQLGLKLHACAARDDVAADVTVAYAGAALQLVQGFTGVIQSLNAHRSRREKRAQTSKAQS